MGEGKEESILTTPFILLSDASTSKVLPLWIDYPPWVGQFLEIIKDLLLKMFKLQTNPFRAYTTFTFFIGLSHIRPLSACPNPSGQGTRQPRAALHLSSCWSDSSSPTQTHLSCLIPSSHPLMARVPPRLGTMSHKLFCNGDCLLVCCCCCYLIIKLGLTLCDPMDCSLPGSSVHGLCQARILEWVAIFFSRGSFNPRDQTSVSCLAGWFFITEPPGKLIVWSVGSLVILSY